MMGITWEQFWDMNPAIILAHKEGYIQRVHEQNALYHLQGMYTREALMATVGNMFKKSGAKPYEYPEKPFELGLDKREENKVLTDADKEEQTRMLFQRLELMQANFELAHSQGNE